MLVLHVPQPRSGMAVAVSTAASVWLRWAMAEAVTAAECEGADSSFSMLYEMLCVRVSRRSKGLAVQVACMWA